jgi:hypothetical protein
MGNLSLKKIGCHVFRFIRDTIHSEAIENLN